MIPSHRMNCRTKSTAVSLSFTTTETAWPLRMAGQRRQNRTRQEFREQLPGHPFGYLPLAVSAHPLGAGSPSSDGRQIFSEFRHRRLRYDAGRMALRVPQRVQFALQKMGTISSRGNQTWISRRWGGERKTGICMWVGAGTQQALNTPQIRAHSHAGPPVE